MARRKVGNPLAFAVLGSLGERSMHPYEISAMLKSRGKGMSIKLNYGSLYSVVAALEKHGLIEAVETVREGNRPERTVYAITETGRAEFEDWLTELLADPVKEFSQLEAGLSYVAAFPPARVTKLLDQRVDKLKREIDEIEGTHAEMRAKEFPQLFWIESEFRLELLKAEWRYVIRLARAIRTDQLAGSAFWRKGFEAVEKLGITPAELFANPRKYFGDDLPWLEDSEKP